MNRDGYKPFVWLMWVVLPTTALNYWSAWDQLPARMAVHFDADWRPNAYTSRESALLLGLSIMAVMLIAFTIGALVAQALKPMGAAWTLLAVFYVSLGIACYGNHLIIEFNRNAQPVHSELVAPNLCCQETYRGT